MGRAILVGRIIIYWFATVAYFGTGIAVSQYCDNADWSFAEHSQAWLRTIGPWIPSTCLLLPLVIYDIIRTSHAFTGPIIRTRQQLAKLAQNPNCTPLVLRQDDYWQDLVSPVNTLQHHILSLHLAIQKQRDVIEELRNGTPTQSDSNSANTPESEALSSAELAAHRIAQVEPESAGAEISEPIGAAS